MTNEKTPFMFGTNNEESYTCGEGAVVFAQLRPEIVKKMAKYVEARADKDVLLGGGGGVIGCCVPVHENPTLEKREVKGFDSYGNRRRVPVRRNRECLL